MATKKEISDFVLFKLAGGIPDGSFPVDERDIWDSLDNKVNAHFKLSHFTANLPGNETIPDNLHTAIYEDIAVTRTSNERSQCTLPVMPIALPKEIGIVEIRPVLNISQSGDRMLGQPVIPLRAGQEFLLGADKLLNGLMGQFGYTPRGRKIIFTKDLTTYNITKVDAQLVVFDISQYGENDTLPIPQDYIDQIEGELINEFAPVVSKTGRVNVWANPNPTIPNNAIGKK
jgi:hypothetical protein